MANIALSLLFILACFIDTILGQGRECWEVALTFKTANASATYCGSQYFPPTIKQCQFDFESATATSKQLATYFSGLTEASCKAFLSSTCASVGGQPASDTKCACCSIRNIGAFSNCDSDDDCLSDTVNEQMCYTHCPVWLNTICQGIDPTLIRGFCRDFKFEAALGSTTASYFAPILQRNCQSVVIPTSCFAMWDSNVPKGLTFEFQIMIIVFTLGAFFGLCIDCAKLKTI